MFLSTPPSNEARAALYSRDAVDEGYVANLTRLWAWRPDVFEAFLSLRKLVTEHAALSLRERSILVCATAASLGDSYCALAWGQTLASETDPITAAAVCNARKRPT
jgi:alkylhydroperoxidase/carboxymuconolactone decarboxylase family protein YurZ